MEPEIVIAHIANSSLAGREQRFRKGRISVGRDGGTDVDFDPAEDLVVSRVHAEFYVQEGALYLRDLDSRNGTYVNHRRITAPVELHPKDSIHFGSGGPLVRARLDQPEPEPVKVGLRQTLLNRLLPRAKAPSERLGSPPDPGVTGPLESDLGAPLPSSPTAPHRSSPTAPSRPGVGPAPRPVAPADKVPDAAAPAPPGPIAAPAAGLAAPAVGPRSWRPLLTLVAAIAVLGIGGTAAYVHLWPLAAGRLGPAPGAAVKSAAPGGVAALGRLEPQGGVLAIGAPAGQTLKTLLVEEGQVVERDEPLAHLSGYDALQAEYDAARTALAEAERQSQTTKEFAAALVEEARKASQQTGKPLDLEIQSVEAEIALLRAHLDVAVEDRKQLEALPQVDKSTLTRQKLVEQRAERELTAAQKRLEQLRESVAARRAHTQAQLQTATANQARLEQSISLKNAEESAKRAKAQFEQAILRAPRAGKVLKILARAGSALGAQPILELADTQHMDVIAEVYETDVRRVAKGQEATITSPALPEKLSGQVDRVLWTVERNRLRDLDPTAPEDLRVVEVRVRLDDAEVAKHRQLLEKLINLQVHVRIAAP